MNKQKYEHRNSFSKQKNPPATRRPTQVTNALTAQEQQQRNDGLENVDLNADMEAHDADNLTVSTVGNNNYPPFSSVIWTENQILTEITFDNFELLRNGFIYVGPPDFSSALSFPETALHHDVQAARPQIDIKAENREKSASTIYCKYHIAI